jgi:hypothetical protein
VGVALGILLTFPKAQCEDLIGLGIRHKDHLVHEPLLIFEDWEDRIVNGFGELSRLSRLGPDGDDSGEQRSSFRNCSIRNNLFSLGSRVNYRKMVQGASGKLDACYLLRRFVFKESAAENTNATLGVQHSQVTNSPVASGSGIIQNIVNVGQQPPAAEPPPKPAEPSPNIQRGDVGLRAIELVGDTWMYAHDVKGQHSHGILLEIPSLIRRIKYRISIAFVLDGLPHT